MSERVSRHKIASIIADKIVARESVELLLKQTAAYLIETNRTREYELLVRDIEDALAHRGTVIADVTSATPLSSEAQAAIKELARHAKSVLVRETIDPSVIGGVRVELPGERFDNTVKHKIERLRALKV